MCARDANAPAKQRPLNRAGRDDVRRESFEVESKFIGLGILHTFFFITSMTSIFLS